MPEIWNVEFIKKIKSGSKSEVINFFEMLSNRKQIDTDRKIL